MKTLDTVVESKGFRYTQVRREGKVAIYEQRLIKGKQLFAYEVIVVQSHNGYELGGNTYPPAEYYPSTNSWGTLGWTYSTIDPEAKKKAVDKMKQVLQNVEIKEKLKQEKASKAAKTK